MIQALAEAEPPVCLNTKLKPSCPRCAQKRAENESEGNNHGEEQETKARDCIGEAEGKEEEDGEEEDEASVKTMIMIESMRFI